MNDITVTVIGTVGTDVRYTPGEKGARVNFRLASTARYFNRSTDSWTDGPTTWLDVVCWRRLADHVESSIAKGDPVIVCGRLRVRQWENERGNGQSVEITATTVGHDLNRGTSAFSRQRPRTAVTSGTGGDAAPNERGDAESTSGASSAA